MRSGRSSCGSAAPLNTTNRRPIARPAAGIFFPQRPVLKLNTHGYSPSVLNKIVQAAGQVKSHQLAAKVLGVVGEISISGRHVNRLTEEIGTELKEKRDRETEDYVHHRRKEPTAAAPQLVAIALDGGRVMTRESGQGPGVHGEQWKEDKVACLLTLEGRDLCRGSASGTAALFSGRAGSGQAGAGNPSPITVHARRTNCRNWRN